MKEIMEKRVREYFRIFGNEKYHICTKNEDGHYHTLCGLNYSGRYSAEPITEYYGDECMSCRHASSYQKKSKKIGIVLMVRIRRQRRN
jgi:hypothetical protein